MQSAGGISSLSITMSQKQTVIANQELFGSLTRQAKKTDWDLVIAKADQQISRAGAVAVALAAVYFASIFIFMF